MEFTDNPLDYQINDRGLAYMPPIDSGRGTIAVHDSSNAEHDELWVALEGVPTETRRPSVAISVDDALMLARQIITLATRRGHDLADGPLADVLAAARIDAIAEFVNRQSVEYRKHSAHAITEDIALAIGMGVPRERFYDEPANPTTAEVGEAVITTGARVVELFADISRDIGAAAGFEQFTTAVEQVRAEEQAAQDAADEVGVLELSTYLGTVLTAAALAEYIPRLIGNLNITANTADLGDNLEGAAGAAQSAIRMLALGEAPATFPPRPYYLRKAGTRLDAIRADALALANIAEAVTAELDGYLDTALGTAEDDTEREEHPDA